MLLGQEINLIGTEIKENSKVYTNYNTKLASERKSNSIVRKSQC